MTQHEHPDDRTREREVIVTDSGRSGSGVSTVVAAIIGIILVLLVGWFLFNLLGTTDGGDGGTTVDVPDEVNVDVEDGAGGGGDAGGDAGGEG